MVVDTSYKAVWSIPLLLLNSAVGTEGAMVDDSIAEPLRLVVDIAVVQVG